MTVYTDDSGYPADSPKRIPDQSFTPTVRAEVAGTDGTGSAASADTGTDEGTDA